MSYSTRKHSNIIWCTHYYNKEQYNYLSFHRNIILPLLRTNVISGSYTIEITPRPSRMQKRCLMQTTYFHILIHHRQWTVWLLDTVGYALVKDISHHYHPLLNKLFYSSQTRSNEQAWHWGASQRHFVRLNKGTSTYAIFPPKGFQPCPSINPSHVKHTHQVLERFYLNKSLH